MSGKMYSIPEADATNGDMLRSSVFKVPTTGPLGYSSPKVATDQPQSPNRMKLNVVIQNGNNREKISFYTILLVLT